MYSCELCNKEFKNKQNFKSHMTKKIPCNRIIKCNNCNIEFKTLQILKNHLNRKNPCKKIDLEEENIKLKEEIEKLKNNKTIINNNTNNITNNNTQINIFSPEGKLYHTYFLKSNPLQQLEFNIDKLDSLSNLSLEEYTDELSNIYNFTNLIKEICFNMELPENWIICKDDLFNKLHLKIDEENIVNCVDNMLYLIYNIAKQVINYNNLEIDLINFYKTFINKYEQEEYKDNTKVRDFIKLCNEELFKHFSKILNIISDRKNNIKVIELKINNFGDENISFIKKNILTNELINIIEKKYSTDFYTKKFKVNNYNYTSIIDIKKIDVFVYFLNLIYNNTNYPSNKTIKYQDDKFLINNNSNWEEIKINELIQKIFSKIHIIIKINKINYESNYLEDYDEETYKQKIIYGYKIGEDKHYQNILKEYYKNNKCFYNHNDNIN